MTLVALSAIGGNAFQPIRLESTFGGRADAGRIGRNKNFFLVRTNHDSVRYASPSEKESDSVQKLFDYDGNNYDDEIDENDLEEIEAGQPPEWMVMQQLLGINIFTVILAVLIVFFLSMNMTLGPGWLGSKLGIPGTGSIQEVSPSLPGTIDLNNPQYRL